MRHILPPHSGAPKVSVFFAFDVSYKPLRPNLEIIDA
jgi:hypothetical protein